MSGLSVSLPDGSTWTAPSLASADRERVRWGGFAEFARLALPLVPLVRDPHWSWHHEELCNHYDALINGRISEFIANVPPGCTKSGLITVLGPAWIWTWRPDYQIMSATFDDSNGLKHAGWTRDVMASRWYQERWGDLLIEATNRREYFTRGNGYRFTTTPEGKGTGRHCDLYSIDDPNKAKDAIKKKDKDFAVALERVNEWIGHSVVTRSAGADMRLALIMQRLHENDAAGHVLRTLGNVSTLAHLMLPYKFEPERRCVTQVGGDRRTTEGELLWPYKTRAVDRAVSLMGGWNGSIVRAQYQQDPGKASGQTFEASSFKPFDPERMPLDQTLSVLSVDPTFKEGASADDVALEVWGFKDGNFFCYHSDVEQRGFIGTLEAMQSIMSLFRCDFILVEDTANGSAIIEVLSQTFPNIEAIKPKGSKAARAQAASHMFKAGRVYFDTEGDWYERKARNLTRFPSKDDHDVDTTSQAILWLLSQFGTDEAFSASMRSFSEETSAMSPRALWNTLYGAG